MQMTVKIFCCYAHEDEALLNKLKTHLKPLQRQELIDVWYDRNISAGTEWGREIDKHLNTAQIILLLVSPDFLASDYCYTQEMQQALERHERGEARVIPVILRPVYWQGVLGNLQALPKDGKPVASSEWHNWDEAFFDVAEGIRKAVEQQNFSTPSSFPNPIGQDLTDQRLDRAAILTRLRKLYILSHDNISPGIMAGTDPLPKEWVEEELKKMGETWRQDTYFVHLDDDLNHAASVTKATFSSTRSQQDSWQEIVTAKLKEFVLLWTLSYGKNSEKLINPFLSEFQTKLILISGQLIRMLSWDSRYIPKGVMSNLGSIAARLENLGRMQFFIDGGLSVSKFNELGDEITKDVESLIERLNSEKGAAQIEDGTVSSKQYEYDVALSYAGEDREYAATLATVLKSRGVKVFYDQYEKPVLWGKDLYIHLSDLYQNKARYCVIFVSKHYAEKVWTKHELKAAQARALKENKEYILPIRFDTSEIPGILSTTAYLNWHQETPESVVEALLEKLGKVLHVPLISERIIMDWLIDEAQSSKGRVGVDLGDVPGVKHFMSMTKDNENWEVWYRMWFQQAFTERMGFEPSQGSIAYALEKYAEIAE